MNQDEQEIQVSTAEQSSEYDAVPTGQDGKRKKQKKKKSGFGKGFAVGAVTMAVVCGVMFWATSGLGLLSAGSSGDLLNRDTEQKIESLASYIQSNYYEDVDTETLEEGLYAGLPVIFLVTLGGFLTNAAYCLQQNVANKSMGDYAKGKVWGNNLVFCALAGVLWYMQFFGLEMGKSFLTESPVLLAFSWCILMALNVTFSNVWGIILKEWKGVSNKTITVLIAGLIVLIFSLVFPNLF